MGSGSFVENIVERKLMDLHCGYIGRVLETDGVTAKVQPLGLFKGQDGTAKPQAPVSDVPVACRYKFTLEDITYVTNVSHPYEGSVSQQKATKTIVVPREIAAGDLVACLCADRDITEARRGKNEQPPAGRHSISDSIIVGILE